MTSTLHERVNLGIGWQELLLEEFKKPYMEHLAAFLKEERRSGVSIYPPANLVFNAFRQTPFEQVKVVIVGQDPYHGPGQAHGLCFSVPEGVPPPPSLKNIYKELIEDVHIPPPKSGCLLPWAHQGVLLLNATLTVRESQAGSHAKQGWEQFTDAALRCLLDRKVVFLLWGRFAKEKVENVIKQAHHAPVKVLTAAHPSPLSAYSGFFGCRHFSKTNQLLHEMGHSPIDWSIN